MTGQHHRRRSLRLKHYDYAQAGAYFVTLCTQNRECLFGEIINGVMRLNTIGRIVVDQWHAIPHRFADVELDEFVVMPNHIHGIFVIVGAPLAGAHGHAPDHGRAPARGAPTGAHGHAPAHDRAPARGAPTVGDIVGAYKSLCVHHGLEWIKQSEPNRILGQLWQRNYWEHIVRNEAELHRIREHIQNNPAQWALDKLYPDRGEQPSVPAEIREPAAIYRYGISHANNEAWMT